MTPGEPKKDNPPAPMSPEERRRVIERPFGGVTYIGGRGHASGGGTNGHAMNEDDTYSDSHDVEPDEPADAG